LLGTLDEEITMGLGIESTTFLEHVKTLGVRFDRTAMIGRQQMYVGGHAAGYAFDASDYEGAENIYDFNRPMPWEFKSRYSVVLDGGTLEHVFNFPQALYNCMRMVEIGGHFLTITPTNNYSGHGFYQLSHEVFFRALSPENGFCVPLMLVCRAGTTESYEIKDGHRMENGAGGETLLMVMAQKTSDGPMFEKSLMQGAYKGMWEGHRTA